MPIRLSDAVALSDRLEIIADAAECCNVRAATAFLAGHDPELIAFSPADPGRERMFKAEVASRLAGRGWGRRR